MDIQVGDRVTYKHDVMEVETTEVIYDLARISTLLFEIEKGNMKILKIERPKYEVVEEKKELLTEEEKEFLRQFNKIEKNKIKEVEMNSLGNLCIENNRTFKNFIHTDKFQNLEKNKRYTLKELGLEEK